MLKKIQGFFKKKEKEGKVTGLLFKESTKALGMETYKGVTILFLSKPKENKKGSQLIYHLFYKQEFYFGEADTYEDLQELARKDIDDKFIRN